MSIVDGVHVLQPAGAIGPAETETLSRLIAVTAVDAGMIIVDLSAVSLIDASAARALRRTAIALGRRGVRFRVAAGAGQPLDVLEVLGFAGRLGARRTIEQALVEIRQPQVAGAGSIGGMVHALLAEACTLDVDDPRRRELEATAIETALPLARTLARRYQHASEPLEDLEQVASIGIVGAVRRYDPTHGSGFTAYAVPTVLGELRRHLRDHGWTVRPPRRLQEVRTEIIAVTSDVAQQVRREPTPADIAAYIGTRVADVEDAIVTTSGLSPTSLDAPLTTGDDHSLYALIGAPDPDIELVDFRWSIRPLIAALPEQVRRVLVLRFEAELTQSQIAARLGTSQMNISRILTSTLATFRRALLVDG